MTRIKLCGLKRTCDIEMANILMPEYIGFVFARKSTRYVTETDAAALKKMLDPSIAAVGVFVRENPERIAKLLQEGIIDIAQLHGGEDEDYISRLRKLTDKSIIKAFRIETAQDITAAQESTADAVLLDSGSGGTGRAFNWTLLHNIRRPYFLAGGLHPGNIREAVEKLNPYAVDVSSGIETDGNKDAVKMTDFVRAIRNA